MEIEKIIETTLSTGGYTKAGAKGYSVALPNYEHKISLHEFTVEKFQEYYDKIKKLGYEIGTWINEGIVYLDAIQLINTKELALKLGEIRNQIAIFDLNNFEEIFI